jgi:hypothetical protein
MLNKIRYRLATEKDIGGILEVEKERYDTLYGEQFGKWGKMEHTFNRRLQNIPKWFWVAEHKNIILGSISALPTDKNCDEFNNWEESTNYGTLDSRVNYEGSNIYVVNLDVKKSWTKKGVQYRLMGLLAEKMIKEGKELLFFESRIPDFRNWVDEKISLKEWNKLDSTKQTKLAQEYCNAEKIVGGEKRPLDRLISFYVRSGFTPDRLVREAFQDGESLNYGIIFKAENPIPSRLRNPVFNYIGSKILKTIMRYPKLAQQII